VDAAGDEVEGGAALHHERRAGMVGQHEDRHVVRGLVAPPAFPALVGPGAAHRPEHVAPEDPGAHLGEALFGDLVVDAGLAVDLVLGFARVVHLLPDARGKKPVHQLGAANSQRMLQALVRAGGEAVERNAQAAHEQSGHGVVSCKKTESQSSAGMPFACLQRACLVHRPFAAQLVPAATHAAIKTKPGQQAHPHPAMNAPEVRDAARASLEQWGHGRPG
jgi:hypothetical protein